MISSDDLIKMFKNHSKGMKHISLSVAIISDETKKYFFNGEELTEQMPAIIYEIGSVTKTFTVSLLQKIIYEGKVSLTDTIDKFIPEVDWPSGVELPTIRQLVTHTSGIGNDIDCATEEAGKDLEKRLASFTGDFEDECIYGYLDEKDYIETLRTIDWKTVSHEFQYSNIGLTIVGIVIERILGVSYEELMEQFIHDELGMYNTWLDIPSKIPNGYSLAIPYGIDQNEKNHWIWHHKIGMAAGGIYSSLEDMVIYLRHYIDNNPNYLEMCHQEQLAYSDVNHFGISMAWIKEGNIVWHNGATGCFHSFVGFKEDSNVGVVMLENHHGISEYNIDEIGKKILTMI